MKRRIEAAERQARLGLRHRLAPKSKSKSSDPVQVADSLVALHSTDPTTVYLSALVRMTSGEIGTISKALYDDRTLIRLLGMRRTVFVTSMDNAQLVQAACSRGVAVKERRKLVGFLAESGVGKDVEGWLANAEEAALKALTARGEATAADLASDDPMLRTQIVLAKGKSYEGKQNVSSRLMLLMAAEGKVVRGRPRGSWMSHQHNWSPMTAWAPDGLDQWDTQDAEVELARRWLASYGTALPEDLQWWTGWTKTQVKRVLAELKPVTVELDSGSGIILESDLEPPGTPGPWAALLPALDPTPMGWQHRAWFLGDHGPKLFDRAGNIGPSLFCDGRIVGGWAQDSSGDIVYRFLEDVGSDVKKTVEAAADKMTKHLDGAKLSARTRGKTWLEEELTA